MATVYNLEVGAHIYVPRLGYQHHGLYIGDGIVAHYTGHSTENFMGEIKLDTVEEFAQEKPVNTITYRKRRFGPLKSIARALSRLNEKFYSVLINNCEHFVTWCVMGWHSSAQVNRALLAAAQAGYDLWMRSRISTPVLRTLKDTAAIGRALIEQAISKPATRIATVMAKYAGKALAIPQVKAAQVCLAKGLESITAIAGSATWLPVAIAIAAYVTIEVFAAATGMQPVEIPAGIAAIVSAVVVKFCGSAKGFLRRAIDAVKRLGSRVWSGVRNSLGGCFNWALDKLGWL